LLNPAPSLTYKDLALVAILTAAALVLRIIGLNEGLWFDEITTLIRYVSLPAREIVSQFDSMNNHILYTLVAHFSVGWFGESAWGVRLPAAVFGVATIPATFYLGRQLMGRNEAFLASAFLAFSYHHVWFSQSARGYTGLLLGTVLSSIIFIRLIAQEKPGYRLVLAYAIVATLATWIHLTAVLVVIAHGIIWLAVVSRNAAEGKTDLKPAAVLSVLITGLFSLALYTPVLFQLWGQFESEILSSEILSTDTATVDQYIWEWETNSWALAEFTHALNKALPGGWPIISLGILAIATGIWSCLKQGIVLAGILVLPVLITLVFVYSFSKVFFPRFLFNSLVFFLFIAVHGGFALCRIVLPMISTRLVTAMGLILALATATLVPGAWQPKQDFVGAMAFVNQHRVAGDAVACPGLTYVPLHLYLGMNCINVRSAIELDELERAHSRTWLLYTLPIPLQGKAPDVWSRIHNNYSPVTRFRGTIGDGDIVIMLHPPEVPALENPVIDDPESSG